MKRYRWEAFTGREGARCSYVEDLNGEWVRWEDVKDLIRSREDKDKEEEQRWIEDTKNPHFK